MSCRPRYHGRDKDSRALRKKSRGSDSSLRTNLELRNGSNTVTILFAIKEEVHLGKSAKNCMRAATQEAHRRIN